MNPPDRTAIDNVESSGRRTSDVGPVRHQAQNARIRTAIALTETGRKPVQIGSRSSRGLGFSFDAGAAWGELVDAGHSVLELLNPQAPSAHLPRPDHRVISGQTARDGRRGGLGQPFREFALAASGDAGRWLDRRGSHESGTALSP